MKPQDYRAYVKIAVLRVQDDNAYCDAPADCQSDAEEYDNEGDDTNVPGGGER